MGRAKDYSWIVSRDGEGEGSPVSQDSASGYRTTKRETYIPNPNTEGGRVGSFYFSQERSVTAVRWQLLSAPSLARNAAAHFAQSNDDLSTRV
jgi:hypothetical protein